MRQFSFHTSLLIERDSHDWDRLRPLDSKSSARTANADALERSQQSRISCRNSGRIGSSTCRMGKSQWNQSALGEHDYTKRPSGPVGLYNPSITVNSGCACFHSRPSNCSNKNCPHSDAYSGASRSIASRAAAASGGRARGFESAARNSASRRRIVTWMSASVISRRLLLRFGGRREAAPTFLNTATAQESPIHIWTKLFAGNGAGRCFFDCRATLSRNRAPTGHPLAHGWRGNAQRARKPADSTDKGAGSRYRFLVHGRQSKAMPNASQEALPNAVPDRFN